MKHFNYYAANIKKSSPLGIIDLMSFFEKIKSPKPHIIETFEKIKQAELDGDGELKGRLKEGLYSFTPCVVVQGSRSYKNIQYFTGLMVLDFDHLDPDYAKEFKEFLFNEYPFIIATWLSASKCGVRALVNIPKVETPEQFKALYRGLAHHEMAQYNGFDMAPQNPVLPLFLSYDPDIYFGDTHDFWDTPYTEPRPPPAVQFKITEQNSKIEKIIISSINKINSNGHPQLRGAAFALGGYVGAGYIDYDNSLQLIYNLIDQNNYLRKKADTYKKTAKTMIDQGLNQPLFL